MNKKQICEIENTLARLESGDLYTPVDTHGVGVYGAIMKSVEELRRKLLAYADKEADMSQRANKAIASVAHDMKTPLAVISGYAECLSDGLDDKDYAALISQKTKEMNEMVIGLVETSREEIKKQSAHMLVHEARVTFGKIMQKLKPIAESKNITLKVSKIPDVKIRLDELQMERVMQNLISNAVKYSDEGTTIKVRFETRKTDFIISVKDKGIGISKESLPLVFDRFYTEDQSRSSGNSQGVGLYIVKGIVGEHGGSVSVKSKKGSGSRFFVTLPMEPNNKDGRSFAYRFDNRPKWQKGLLYFFFGWFISWIYRFSKFAQSNSMATLVTGITCLAPLPFVYFIDNLTIWASGKITFIAD